MTLYISMLIVAAAFYFMGVRDTNRRPPRGTTTFTSGAALTSGSNAKILKYLTSSNPTTSRTIDHPFWPQPCLPQRPPGGSVPRVSRDRY